MSINLRIFLILMIISFIILILHTIKKQRLLLKYSLLWLGTTALMFLCVIFPEILNLISKLLGIEIVSNLVFLMGFLILITLTFVLTIIVSEQNKKITSLTEEIAILKHTLNGGNNDKKTN